MARSSSSPRTPTEAGRRACCIRSAAAPEVGPLRPLIFDAAGNLYGTTTAGGGVDGNGTVFKLTPNANGSWTESVLYSFSSFKKGDGDEPGSGLIFDAAGNLYGTTFGGGAYGPGAVFRLTPKAHGSWTETVVYSFNGRAGEYPYGGLIFDDAAGISLARPSMAALTIWAQFSS